MWIWKKLRYCRFADQNTYCYSDWVFWPQIEKSTPFYTFSSRSGHSPGIRHQIDWRIFSTWTSHFDNYSMTWWGIIVLVCCEAWFIIRPLKSAVSTEMTLMSYSKQSSDILMINKNVKMLVHFYCKVYQILPGGVSSSARICLPVYKPALMFMYVVSTDQNV